MVVLELVVGALGAVGFAIALYFTLVTYRWMRPDPRWLPRGCRMGEASCARVVDAPQARVLVVPNSVLGLAWYAGAIGGAVARAATGSWPACTAFLAAGSIAVALGAYLAWALLVRLRAPCPLCFAGHGVNVAIVALVAVDCA